jgi:hypothetical protein
MAEKDAGSLTHLGADGAANMVDVASKDDTVREAVAEGHVSMTAETLDAILSGNAKKGDVVSVARIAGIMAAKKTHELIPLCHPLMLSKVSVEIEPDPRPARISRRGAGPADRQDWRRDGGADGGLRRLPDDLRHGESHRQGHGDRACPAGLQDWR